VNTSFRTQRRWLPSCGVVLALGLVTACGSVGGTATSVVGSTTPVPTSQITGDTTTKSTTAPTSAPLQASPLTFTSGGFRYTIEGTPFKSVVDDPEVPARPGYHYLVATYKVQNIQTDREAPNPLKHGQIQYLAPRKDVAAEYPAGMDVNLLPCYDPLESNANADPMRGAAKDLCLSDPFVNTLTGTHLYASSDVDTPLQPNGDAYVTYRSVQYPDALPPEDVSAWILDDAIPPAQAGLYQRIPLDLIPPG